MATPSPKSTLPMTQSSSAPSTEAPLAAPAGRGSSGSQGHSTAIQTVDTSGIFAGVMHDLSMRFALAGPWRMTGWASHRRVVGTCAICGQGIANVVHVVAKDGRAETIGFDCATTLFLNQGDKAEIARVKKAQSDHERQLRAERAKKASDAKARRVGRCAALLMSEVLATRFRAAPHPHAYWAEKGKTMFDYLGFCLRSGAVGACKLIEKESVL